MKAAEIIMQQRKIERENEEAKRKMAYDIIRDWADENKDYFSELLLKAVIRFFTDHNARWVQYKCIAGLSNYPLGEKYTECVGTRWNVEFFNERGTTQERISFNSKFFSSSPIEQTRNNEDLCRMFVSYYVFHTTFPELLRDEGFEVEHHGCGCCEEIIIKLPNE